jgi:capsid protein
MGALAKPRFKPTSGMLWGEDARPGKDLLAYAAASHEDPGLLNWYPSIGSADADLLPELGTIRPRSRDLERNNGYGAGANQTYKDNIVGHQLRLNANPDALLLGWKHEEAKQWGLFTNAQFATWANDPGEVDAARSMTLLGLTIQALGGWFINGDALAIPHWLPRDGARWNTRMQVIEGDRLDTPPHLTHRPDIRGGVEIDGFGAPVAYWIRRTHPGDRLFATYASYPEDWTRIPAFSPWGRRRVIHLHDRERAGANRSKPVLTSIMREFRMATHYTRTELQATIANSLIAAFLESSLDQDTLASLFSSAEDRQQYWKSALQEYRPALKSGAVTGQRREPRERGRPKQEPPEERLGNKRQQEFPI